jgi:dephospho-CoA kinase
MGSGKSSVAILLSDLLAARYIDVDAICRQLLEPGEAGWLALRRILPRNIFRRDETINRRMFRQVLFTEKELRLQVNSLLHPLAREVTVAGIGAPAREGSGTVVIEVPLLFEAGWVDLVDRIIVVYADCAVRLQRITNRDLVSDTEAETGMAVQESLLAKVLLADHVIDNSSCWPETYLQISHLARVLGRKENENKT